MERVISPAGACRTTYTHTYNLTWLASSFFFLFLPSVMLFIFLRSSFHLNHCCGHKDLYGSHSHRQESFKQQQPANKTSPDVLLATMDVILGHFKPQMQTPANCLNEAIVFISSSLFNLITFIGKGMDKKNKTRNKIQRKSHRGTIRISNMRIPI